ncbi:MAG: hypothetical protein M0R46_08425 [Candidatus Muirbacterium halophilum]|nr:hypothetical protein [Candidatus Muirbacterium halophilum]MCK9475929.1 hypothetical protein [Candidatus Muirbacterium halophilum]
MKKISIITNIGTNDFSIPNEFKTHFINDFNLLDDDIVSLAKKNYFEVTKKIFNILDNDQELLNKYKINKEKLFPIYNSYINKLKNEYSDIVTESLIIVTQQEALDKGFHAQDTKYCGKLIELFFKGKNSKFEIVQIAINPTNYVIAYEEYNKKISQKINNITNRSDLHFVCPTAGAPALMFSLIMVSINLPKKIRFMYSVNNENGQSVNFIEFADMMKTHFLSSYIKEIKNNKKITDYSVMEEFYQISDNKEKTIISKFLLNFYQNRFKQSLNILSNEFETYSISNQIKDFDKLKIMIKDWKKIDNKIQILFSLIENLFEKENITELIIKINCILEAMVLKLNENYFNVSADLNYNSLQKNILAKNQDLNNFYSKIIMENKEYDILKDLSIDPWNDFKKWNKSSSNNANFLINLFYIYQNSKDKELFKVFFDKHKEIYLIINEYRNNLAHDIIDIGSIEIEDFNFIEQLKIMYKFIYKQKYPNLIARIKGLLNK